MGNFKLSLFLPYQVILPGEMGWKRSGVAKFPCLSRMVPITLFTAVLFATAAAAGQDQGTTKDYRNDEAGFSLKLPDESWNVQDRSQSVLKILLFSPTESARVRATVMLFPNSILPEGLLTREQQVQAAFPDTYKRVAYEDAMLAGRDSKRWEYESIGTTSIEWAFEDGEFLFVFQLSAPDDEWQNPEVRDALHSIRDSLEYRGAAIFETAEVDRSTPAEVRERRAESLIRPKRTFEVLHHDLDVSIDPAGHGVTVTDQLSLQLLEPDVTTIELYTSFVDVLEVSGVEGITWFSEEMASGSDALKITFAEAPAVDTPTTLTVKTGSEDYFLAVDQQLVQEVAVMGQAREESTYSSHIAYYPIDVTNDATVHIRLQVPTGYTAVTGGEFQGATTEGERTVFTYHNDHRRKRLLPFGFAVAKYISGSGFSDGGLKLEVYGFPGEEALIDQRVEAAVEVANLFENMMGPLPWDDVRIAHVTPVRKETGVSLPGLIVISDGFFTDFSAVDLSDGNMANRDAFSLLVVADELSHQWNIYSAPLSNELGEGISTYTNMLFIESRHGQDAYRNGIAFCRSAYLQSTAIAKDVAIASPEVYQTTAYRGIVFCKTPVILAMLRDLTGDENFFAAWRMAFSRFDPGQDGFEIIEQAFNETTGADWGWFFDQWFFQAGYPELSVEHEQSGKQLTVTIKQVQPSDPYRLRGLLRINGPSGRQLEQMVELVEKDTVISVDCSFKAESIEFDPEDRLLKKTVDSQR